MDRMSHGCEKFAAEPLPYVSGLRRLIPEQRLVAILTRTARLSVRRRSLPRRLRDLARHCHGPVRRRFNPEGLAPPPPDP